MLPAVQNSASIDGIPLQPLYAPSITLVGAPILTTPLQMVGEDGSTSKRVRKPCSKCINAKVGCDHKRPCSRCVKRGEPDQCFDIVRKKRASKKNLPQDFDVSAILGIDATPLPYNQLQSNADLENFLDTLIAPSNVVITVANPNSAQDDIASDPIAVSCRQFIAAHGPQSFDSSSSSGSSTPSTPVSPELSNLNRAASPHQSPSQLPPSPTSTPTTVTTSTIVVPRSRSPSKSAPASPALSSTEIVPRGIGLKVPRAIFSYSGYMTIDCNIAFSNLLGFENPNMIIGKSLKDFIPTYSARYAEKSLNFFKDNGVDHYERLGIFNAHNRAIWATMHCDLMELTMSLSVLDIHDTVPKCFRAALKKFCGLKSGEYVFEVNNTIPCPRSHCQCKVYINKNDD